MGVDVWLCGTANRLYLCLKDLRGLMQHRKDRDVLLVQRHDAAFQPVSGGGVMAWVH